MTKTEIDVMWSRALREALEGGEEFTRYRFAAMVASAEREASARAAGIALLGAEKALSDRVINAIRARGQA